MPATTPLSRSPHVRRKQAQRRREILHAALSAFREHGYHATSLDDIAARLGVRKTALYHYFADKDALLYECHRESLAELDRIMAASVDGGTSDGSRPAEGSRPADGSSSVSARLAHLIREHVRIMTDTLEGSPLAFEVPALSHGRRAEIVAGRDRYERFLRELVAEGIAAGEFRAVDPRVVVFAMLGSINWIARWYRPGGRMGGEELGRQYADYLVGGLR